MALEHAKSFFSKLVQDASFNENFKSCKTPEERIALVREHGFDFSPEELVQARSLLTDKELDNISGGSLPACVCPDFARLNPDNQGYTALEGSND